MAAKKAKKNSLVNNINKRKKAGKSRPKSRSTVSKNSYATMEAGWPGSAAKKKSGGGRKKTAAKKKSGGARKKTAAKKKSGGAKKKTSS